MGASVFGSDFSRNEGGASEILARVAVDTGSTESESERDKVRRVFAWVGMEEFRAEGCLRLFDPIGA